MLARNAPVRAAPLFRIVPAVDVGDRDTEKLGYGRRASQLLGDDRGRRVLHTGIIAKFEKISSAIDIDLRNPSK